ncbi:hypothetical protein BVI1335_2020006 [Burkholderia vietnamiensis]|nr:hypothetical protein BVI1335_2020006 [Burkholderia vietnamiensis]
MCTAHIAACLENRHGCQIAQESDCIEQIRFPHTIGTGNASEQTELNVDLPKILEPDNFQTSQHDVPWPICRAMSWRDHPSSP